jgi:hypothetical protein
MAGAAAAGCSRASASEEKIDAMLAKLDSIDKRLEALEKRPVGGNMTPPPRRGLNPNDVYAVAVDPDDAYRGPKAAKVTIVEAFEFA